MLHFSDMYQFLNRQCYVMHFLLIHRADDDLADREIPKSHSGVGNYKLGGQKSSGSLRSTASSELHLK